MNLRSIVSRVGVPLLGIGLIAVAYRWYGWAGVAAAATALVMWALLHFNRLMRVLQRAAKRPIGYVDSAVMLNAKLKAGVSLMHVMAMTKALGEVRPAPRGQERLKEAAKLGFSVAVLPKANAPRKPIEGLTVHAVERIEQAMDVVRGLS